MHVNAVAADAPVIRQPNSGREDALRQGLLQDPERFAFWTRPSK